MKRTSSPLPSFYHILDKIYPGLYTTLVKKFKIKNIQERKRRET
jgi:hypothetical protein